jgi:hypothetical protein
MTFLRSVHCYNLVGALATPLSPQVPKLQQSMHISCYIALVHKSFESYKRLWLKAKLQDTNTLKVLIYPTWYLRRNQD